jgi:zinc protease
MSDKFVKRQLDNSLSVLLKETHHAPVATLWAWYRAGSRNEWEGSTGAAHWIEHMLGGRFKLGSESISTLIARLGGVGNAATFFDYTSYFATLPADHFDVALQIEAARMQGYRFRSKLVNTERTVIISERQWLENEPQNLLFEALLGVAFQVHPYRRDAIGYLCDLQAITADDLRRFHRTFYVPNNAFLVAVGDFQAEALLGRIDELFGSFRPGPEPPCVHAVEPPQRGERRVTIEGKGATAYVQLAVHVPEAHHPDFPALVALDSILAGAGSFTMFGGGASNASSRLYRALVDTELAIGVSGSLIPTVDPFIYLLASTVRAGHTLAEVEAALDAELTRVVNELVSEEELTRALKQARAQFVYGSESVTNQGYWYGWSEIFADYTWFETYLERLAAVTVDDVQRVAKTYLERNNRTVGYYIPEGD